MARISIEEASRRPPHGKVGLMNEVSLYHKPVLVVDDTIDLAPRSPNPPRYSSGCPGGVKPSVPRWIHALSEPTTSHNGCSPLTNSAVAESQALLMRLQQFLEFCDMTLTSPKGSTVSRLEPRV